MDNRHFSQLSWELYEISKQDEYFTLLHNTISNIIGAPYHLFDDTIIFLSNMKASLI